jgi:hypothetical protein
MDWCCEPRNENVGAETPGGGDGPLPCARALDLSTSPLRRHRGWKRDAGRRAEAGGQLQAVAQCSSGRVPERTRRGCGAPAAAPPPTPPAPALPEAASSRARPSYDRAAPGPRRPGPRPLPRQPGRQEALRRPPLQLQPAHTARLQQQRHRRRQARPAALPTHRLGKCPYLAARLLDVGQAGAAERGREVLTVMQLWRWYWRMGIGGRVTECESGVAHPLPHHSAHPLLFHAPTRAHRLSPHCPYISYPYPLLLVAESQGPDSYDQRLARARKFPLPYFQYYLIKVRSGNANALLYL